MDVLQQMKKAGLTSVFYPWKLHLASSNPFSGQIFELGLPIIIGSNDNAHNEWEVLEVVDSWKTKKYRVQYKATYMGNWDK